MYLERMGNHIPNSSIQLQSLVDDAQSFGDLAPALAAGGFSDAPALSIANDVMTAMLLGGPNGQPFNWKFNRFNLPKFYTISWQQDYFIPGLVNLAWIESAWASNINMSSTPKYIQHLEVRKDLMVDWLQTGYPGKVCWLPNDFCTVGQWGQTQLVNPIGLKQPGPGVVYTNPQGANITPINPCTVINDTFGNFWTVTQYGVCGQVNPFLTNLNPTFPTPQNQTIPSTTVQDGTVIWTAINPKGQGLRLDPLPPQSGVVWQIQIVGQMRVPYFTKLTQTLEPIPDDYYPYFKQGFFAQCFRRSPDPKVRAKFQEEWNLWLKALENAIIQANREEDDFGFYPGQSVMDSSWTVQNMPSPANPFGPWS